MNIRAIYHKNGTVTVRGEAIHLKTEKKPKSWHIKIANKTAIVLEKTFSAEDTESIRRHIECLRQIEQEIRGTPNTRPPTRPRITRTNSRY